MSKKGIGGMGSWLHKKIVDPFIKIIRRGAEPKQLAFSTALGISLGVFPIVGVTVFLCGLAIALLGPYVNAPTVMLANFIATPLELRSQVAMQSSGKKEGFTRFESVWWWAQIPWISRPKADALKKVLTGEGSTEIFVSFFHALLGWLVLAPLILGALYIILLPCFIILVHKLSNSSNPKLTTPSSTDLRLKVRDN